MHPPRLARRQFLFPLILLTLAVGAVFFPILDFEFINYDATFTVIDNPHIRSLSGENLRQMFTSRCVTSYYPVRSLSYAVDFQLWGLNPRGFKLTNGLIHLANTLLVFWLVLRLLGHPSAVGRPSKPWWDVNVATFSAAAFAIHPVVVEPVAWVPGREELLMTLGALGCLHFHLGARRLGHIRARTARTVACHVGATFCCALACLSNAVGAVIPLLIVAWDLLAMRPPSARRIFYGTAALWVIAAATIVAKVGEPTVMPLTGDAAPDPYFVQRLGNMTGVFQGEVELFSADQLLLVPTVYWLNLKTLIWPTRLCAAHTWLRPQSFLDGDFLLGTLAIGLTCVLLWSLRRRRLFYFGLLWFGLSLAPVSQIMPHHLHRAERFLYLPLVGLAIALAMGLRPLNDLLKGRIAAVLVAAGGILAVLAVVSSGQVRTWQNTLTMWEACVQAEPHNARAHMQFSEYLATYGQSERAAEHRMIAARLDPNILPMIDQLALESATAEPEHRRDYERARTLATRACWLTEWKDPKYLRTLAVVHGNLAESLRGRGELDQAIENFQIAIELGQAAADVKLVAKFQRGLEAARSTRP